MSKQTIVTIIVFIVMALIIGVGVLELQKKKEIIPESETPLTPKEVVQKFIEADMAGARIGGEAAKQAPEIRQYYVEGAFAFEPGWDTAMTIKNFEIVEYDMYKDVALVEVLYFCENGAFEFNTDSKGKIAVSIKDCQTLFSEWDDERNLAQKFNYENNTERVLYLLREEEGNWKILYPLIPPHISIDIFQKRFDEILKEN